MSRILAAVTALGGAASRRAVARHLGVSHATIAFTREVDAALRDGEVVAVGAGPKSRIVLPELAEALAAGEAARAAVWG